MPYPPEIQERLKRVLFDHPDWIALDGGQTTEAQVVNRIANTTSLTAIHAEAALAATKRSFVELPQTVGLMQEMHANGVPLYCLSNMSIESFEALQHRAFFQLFEGTVISGIEKVMKPSTAIFELLLNRYQLDARTSIFVDDMPENVAGAELLGITGVVFSGHDADYRRIRELVLRDE
ncbi:MAG: HAD-IA family hydrolase [Pseudomonadota bacterium]